MKDILYSYASDEAGRPIHISQVHSDLRNSHSYFCIECGEPMQPKLGNIRQHHFSHLSGRRCNGESYLHRLAKLLLKKKFDETGTFPIEIARPVRCSRSIVCPFYQEKACTTAEYDSFDLRNYYDTCRQESLEGGFIADLLLSDSSGAITVPVLIEIMVTHRCTNEKRNSGLKIMEIPINSDSDITFHTTHPIREGRVRLYGFQRGEMKHSVLSKRRIARFFLYGSGCVFAESGTGRPSCDLIGMKIKSESVLELNIDSDALPTALSPCVAGIIKSMELGHDIRSCLVCKHVNNRKGTLDCRMSLLRDTPRNPSQSYACGCQYYALDTGLQEIVREAIATVPITVVK